VTEATLNDAGFDFADIDVGDVEATSGPLTGSRGTRGPKPGTRRRPAAKKLDTLQKKLSSEMFQAGTMLGMALHTTGYYICQESDAFTKAVMQLAATRPEWIDALENIANIQPGLVIGRTALGIGASIAVDRNRLDPEKQFCKFLGVYSAYESWTQNLEPGKVEGSAYIPPPAGAFVPVGKNGTRP
jgi:hypothetical protein